MSIHEHTTPVVQSETPRVNRWSFRPGAVAILSLFAFSCLTTGCAWFPPSEASLRSHALELSRSCIIVDTHIDVPYRLWDGSDDITGRTPSGDFDYPRAVEGGLDAPFFSIYVPSDREGNGARGLADSLIDLVYGIAARTPGKFTVARSVRDVRSAFGTGKLAVCMGMENGAPIEGDLANVRYFYDRGIRYITLAHARDNHICDSSYDTTRTWKGLSPFGASLIPEMNRVGIMVDVSHITDDAFFQVIALSKAPVIASHSSCRHFTPGFERNMSDEMISTLAGHGGIIMINFGSSFLTEEFQRKEREVSDYIRSHHWDWDDHDAREYVRQYQREHPPAYADVSDVADHIDHVVKLVGVNFVGFGSDFDGVGDSLPTGLKDVSNYPNLLLELLRRGYSDGDIQKICGENLLRVWDKVEQTSRELQSGASG